jgi:hypothetical protein
MVEGAADGDVVGAADGDEVGVLVVGKNVGTRDGDLLDGTAVEGENEGDADGEAVVDVIVSTIAPFPPGD